MTAGQENIGYDDTPFIPDSEYRVHDGKRPQPRIVTPGRETTQEHAGTPPADAVVLFDGVDLSKWQGKNGGAAPWKVENGYMEVVPKSGNIVTKDPIGNCQLHVEWAAPAQVEGDSQGRGNSGVFLLSLYEVQVLDCYDNPTYADGTTGALYGQYPPLVNACRKPGEWQTYDIVWIGPKFDGDNLISPARITVLLNGILLHHDKELQGPTQHKKTAEYKPEPPEAPLMLQDHSNPNRFRNIWYRAPADYDQPSSTG